MKKNALQNTFNGNVQVGFEFEIILSHDDLEKVQGQLERLFKTTVAINTESIKNKEDYSIWHIEPDTSLATNTGGKPMEIVSPVYPMKQALLVLRMFFNWMALNKHTTNETTGFHVNMSVTGVEFKDYDFMKMIVFYNEPYIAKLFNRIDNRFAKSMKNNLPNILKYSKKDGYLDLIKKDLNVVKQIGYSLRNQFNKYFTINNRGNGVFEFRGMGGRGYHRKFDIIAKQILKMGHLLELGSNKDMYLQEYARKLYKIIPNDYHYEMPRDISSFNNTEVSMSSFVDYQDFIQNVGEKLFYGDIKLTPLQQKQLKMAIDKYKLDTTIDSVTYMGLKKVL